MAAASLGVAHLGGGSVVNVGAAAASLGISAWRRRT